MELKGARDFITEKELQQAVLDMAKATGWLVYHSYDSRMDEAGFPDLVLIKPPRVLFVELKAQKGKLSREQVEFGFALNRCCEVEYNLWRPGDWQEIEAELTKEGERR